MKNKFLNFINEKNAELEGTVMNYEQECSLIGTYPLTSRQPPTFHAMLSVLENFVPLTSRGEIIYTAIASAFDTFVSQYADYSKTTASEYHHLFAIAFTIKCAKESSEQGSVVSVATADNKARADLLLAAIKNRSQSIDEIKEEFADLISLYSNGSGE